MRVRICYLCDEGDGSILVFLEDSVYSQYLEEPNQLCVNSIGLESNAGTSIILDIIVEGNNISFEEH